jgi:hypothetical protein
MLWASVTPDAGHYIAQKFNVAYDQSGYGATRSTTFRSALLRLAFPIKGGALQWSS